MHLRSSSNNAELKLIKEANTDYLKKYNRYESIMGNNAFQVDWMIGNTCNYACTYCDDHFIMGQHLSM